MENATNIRERAHIFSLAVMGRSKSLPRCQEAWIIRGQLLRSALSIGANLHDAKSASSRSEFERHYETSLKSANETIYWLRLLRDSRLIAPDEVGLLSQEAERLSELVGQAVLAIRSRP